MPDDSATNESAVLKNFSRTSLHASGTVTVDVPMVTVKLVTMAGDTLQQVHIAGTLAQQGHIGTTRARDCTLRVNPGRTG